MKKILGIVFISLLLIGNAFAKKPIIECSLVDGGNVVGKVIYDLNDSNKYKITKYDSGQIKWYHFADTGERMENFVNRITGSYTISFIEKNGYKHHFTGECKAGSLKQKF
tara:strand:+ start:132 stop:461 length:330 start_codon:yes stop_codon:yes gene_type:complete